MNGETTAGFSLPDDITAPGVDPNDNNSSSTTIVETLVFFVVSKCFLSLRILLFLVGRSIGWPVGRSLDRSFEFDSYPVHGDHEK